jgi:uncharacterized cupredoxin-like copper-binding protein
VARKLLTVFAIVIPLTVAACGSDDETSSTSAATETTATESSTTVAAGGETLGISETDFALNPADPTVKAGTVTFDVTNDGGTVHNLEIEGAGVEEVTSDLGPGESAQLAVDLKPGSYEIYCNIANHRELGMDGKVTVQ